MAYKELGEKLIDLLKKYRYVILVLLIGFGLMMIPPRKTDGESVSNASKNDEKDVTTISTELAHILSCVDGAGDVEVLLTLETGEETVYQIDEDISVETESSSTQIHTVLVTNSDRNESGLVRQTIPPKYKGAIIVCQGADDPQIHLAIVNAVARVTGLGADRISVLKMK